MRIFRFFLLFLLIPLAVPLEAQTDPPANSPSDTLRITVREAVLRAMDPSLGTAAAQEELRAASASLQQAGAFSNPVVNTLAEHPGGVDVGLPISLSGARRARIGTAAAGLELARSSLEDAMRGVAYRVTQLLVEQEQAEARLRAVEGEVDALEALHENLTIGTRLGEVSVADAARALLALGQARSERARALRTLADAQEAVLARLGYPAGTLLALTLSGTCSAQAPGAPEAQETIPLPLRSLALQQVMARQAVAEARAAQLPVFTPQVGWRRDAGSDAVAIGFEWEVPLLNRRQAGVEEARARERAAEAVLTQAQRQWQAERAALLRHLDALAAAGMTFDATWHEALALTVGAAEAIFQSGEGSLEQVLQARRARLASLDDAFSWEADLRTARLAWYATEGRLPDDDLFCSPLNQELR